MNIFTTALSIIVVVILFTVVAYVLPHMYNQGVQSDNTHQNYCNNIQSQILNLLSDPSKYNSTIQTYLSQQAANCSH